MPISKLPLLSGIPEASAGRIAHRSVVSLFSTETDKWFSYYLKMWCMGHTEAINGETITISNVLEAE